ncbi:MAG: DUF5050 domain-containing protein [Lachnospiraceae bacterium]|nr:DUF5050 domain-containing protein [Lachnospiraceae bacterium]
MKSKIIKIVIVIVLIIAIVLGIIACYHFNKFEYNDDDATGNTAGNLYNGGLFCEYNGYIYFSNPNDYNQLYRMDEDGDNIEKVHSDKPRFINICNDYIYYVRYNHDSGQEVVFRGNMFGVYRMKINSDDPVELYAGLADSLMLSGNKLYFQSYNDEDLIEVKSVGIDGKEVEKVSKDDFLPVSVYDEYIYYSNVTGNHNIVKMDTEDNLTMTIKTGNFYMPIVEDNVLYYIDVENNYCLMKQDLSTGKETVLTKDRCINYNVSTKYEVIYYQCENDTNDHRLMMMDLDGNDLTLIEKGDFSNIHITKNYTYFYRLQVGADKELFYVKTGKESSPKRFQ